MWDKLRIVVLLLVLIMCVDGHKKGAPLYVCKTMTPGHGVGAQTSPAPYIISSLNAQNVNGRVRVQVYANAPTYFSGFLLQARAPSSEEAVGSFISIPEDSAYLNCGTVMRSAVTHKDDRKRKAVEVDWEAPPGYEGTVTFVGTIVYNYTTFWVRVESLPVDITKRSSGLDVTEESKQLRAAETSLYVGCGTTKNCVSSPDGCEVTKSCDAAVAVSQSDGAYQFEMFAKGSKYVAVGLSDDNIMGGDSVFECLPEAGSIRAYRSWNEPNRKQNSRIDDQTGIALVNGLYLDGVIYCKIKVDPVISVGRTRFDLNSNEYYLLLAAGRELHPSGVGFHDVVFTASKDRRQLSDVKPVENNDPFYDGCNVVKNCFGSPSGCVKHKNCKAVTSVTVQGQRYIFEMQAKDAAYVATGLSTDRTMGGDSVVECVRDESDRIKAYLSWNVPGQKNNTRIRSQNVVVLENGAYVDGIVHCTVRHEPVYMIEGQPFDLMKQEYVLLLAAGSSIKQNGVDYHDILYTASAQKRALADVAEFSTASRTLLHLHGTFMIAAWIGTASVGIILARYFKQTWTKRSLCGKDVWFAWHRFFMLITWILTIAGVVIMYIEVGGFATGPSQTHALLGAITTILAFIQPIGATFRPHPDSSRRPIFNWLHWFIGNAAHIVAIVTIFLAVDLGKAQLPKWTDWLLVAYVALYVFTHLVLSITACLTERSGSVRINSFPMKDINTRGPPHQQHYERRKDAMYSGFRKFIFCLYFLAILGFVVVLGMLVVFSPIK